MQTESARKESTNGELQSHRTASIYTSADVKENLFNDNDLEFMKRTYISTFSKTSASV